MPRLLPEGREPGWRDWRGGETRPTLRSTADRASASAGSARRGSSAHRRCACPENPPRKDIAGYVHVDSSAKEIKKDKLLPKPTYKQIREYIRKKYDMKVSTLNIITVKDELGLEKQFSWKKDGMAAKNRPQCPKDKQDAIIEAFKHFEMIS